MLRRLTAWLPIVRRSARRRRPGGVRLAVEDLLERVVPAAYSWTGASGVDLNWSTLGNWSWDGQGAVPAPPGSDDDVTLGADAVDDENHLRNPVMDRDFTIRSLKVPEIGGTQYTLTLHGELDVFGDATSTIASGTINGGKIVFGPSDACEFDWTGGTIGTEVDIQASTTFHMSGPGAKNLTGIINDYANVSDWNGEGSFLLSSATVGKFTVEPGANFNISSTGNAAISVVAGSIFRNEGAVSTAMPAGKKLAFAAPGAVLNFGTWNVTSGDVETRTFQNSGAITIAALSEFRMGLGDGNIGDTYLMSDLRPC